MFNWFADLIRFIQILLDRAVYSLASVLYEVFIAISDVRIFSPDFLDGFSRRIYVFVGIFMLFKLSFSVINYIVSPDTLTDSSKGFGKLGLNVIIVLIALVGTPFVFDQAMNLQTTIIKSKVIEKVVTGKEALVDDSRSTGEMLSFLAFSSFVKPNSEIEALACGDDLTTLCYNGIGSSGELKDDLFKKMDRPSFAAALKLAEEGKSITPLLVGETAYVRYDGDYVLTYPLLITLIIGVFLVALLLEFCISVSIRAVKLGFLQLISPIPIIAYVDPGAKDGVTGKWFKECVKTYLDLFMRIAVISLAVFMISQIDEIISAENIANVSGVVKVFLMFGLLLFARQLPKLIEEVFGINLGGGIFSNLKDAFGMVGRVAGVGLGVATGIAAGASAGAVKSGPLGGLTGALGGAVRGFGGGVKNSLFGKGGMESLKGGMGVGGKVGANSMAREGSRFYQRWGSQASRAVGMQDKQARRQHGYQTKRDNIAVKREALSQKKASLARRKQEQLMPKQDRQKSLTQTTQLTDKLKLAAKGSQHVYQGKKFSEWQKMHENALAGEKQVKGFEPVFETDSRGYQKLVGQKEVYYTNKELEDQMEQAMAAAAKEAVQNKEGQLYEVLRGEEANANSRGDDFVMEDVVEKLETIKGYQNGVRTDLAALENEMAEIERETELENRKLEEEGRTYDVEETTIKQKELDDKAIKLASQYKNRS